MTYFLLISEFSLAGENDALFGHYNLFFKSYDVFFNHKVSILLYLFNSQVYCSSYLKH